MFKYTDRGNSRSASQQEEAMKIRGETPCLENLACSAKYATPSHPANLITGHSLTNVQRVSFTDPENSTPALTYASTLGTPVDPALSQDYVPHQGSAFSFKHQPSVPNNPSPDRFVCLMPGCPVTCSRLNDLYRHYNARHQIPGLKPEFKCHVDGCNRKEIPFTRKDKLREHLRNIHYIV